MLYNIYIYLNILNNIIINLIKKESNLLIIRRHKHTIKCLKGSSHLLALKNIKGLPSNKASLSKLLL